MKKKSDNSDHGFNCWWDDLPTLNKKFHQVFQNKLKKLPLKLKGLSTQSLPSKISSEIKSLKSIFPSIGQDYCPLKWYWIKNVEHYLSLITKTSKLKIKHGDHFEYTKTENDLFEYFSSSEWGVEFLKQPDQHLKDRCWHVIALAMQELIFFAQRHFSKGSPSTQIGNPLLDIGETKRGHKIFHRPSFVVEVDNYQLSVFGVPTQEHTKQKKRIQKALELLKKFSPSSYHRVTTLTHTLVAIKDPGIVSFSSQDLPGYSTINLWHRDDVDLLDDLVHESGHHHLNLILNQTPLIIEDQEEIFYSPWRKAPRPIRGIYHAYFTFFWAMDLFANLYKNGFKKPKVLLRFQEEYHLLSACHQSLKMAFKLKKINYKGNDIIKDLMTLLLKNKKWVKDSFLLLNKGQQKKLILKIKKDRKMELDTLKKSINIS